MIQESKWRLVRHCLSALLLCIHYGLAMGVLSRAGLGCRHSRNGLEGRRSVEIILAIYKSAETGKAVQLPLKSDPVLKARANKRR